MAISMLIFARNQSTNILPLMMGLFLKINGTSSQVMVILSNYESFICKSSFLHSSSRAIKKNVRLGRSLYNELFRGISHLGYQLCQALGITLSLYVVLSSTVEPLIRQTSHKAYTPIRHRVGLPPNLGFTPKSTSHNA